jgi:hypothetical protein
MNLTRQVYRLFFYSPHWRVGWRIVGGKDVWDRGDLAGVPWRALPNAPFRFFADPFPVCWRGHSYIFFEDFDHRLGKGVISAVEVDESGIRGEVFPALEEPWHLSYPFMLEHEGQLWMLPESSASTTISLYRADPFPGRWIKEAELICGVKASDATIVRHDDLFWLFATVESERGTSFDALHIFFSRSLFGPWIAHPKNPVVVDLRCARPAGNLVFRDGKLWRPAQDCEAGYGVGIGLAEVTRLNQLEFEQVVRVRLRPDVYWPGRKLHTLNRAGQLECIDGSANTLRRLWPGERVSPSRARDKAVESVQN